MCNARSRAGSRKGLSAGMSRRQGFTLIELLIVVVIIGILAAIAIPKFASTKGKAVVASMKSDLRNLASSQEGYWVEFRTYYGGAIPNAVFTYRPTEGVTVAMLSASDAGWSARASSPTTPQTCVIFYGNAPPIPPATTDGAVVCS
jgi:prepilin-type N-terminal cleavage/methylation domain-containing protein